jgi:PleD family two-component response regulator
MKPLAARSLGASVNNLVSGDEPHEETGKPIAVFLLDDHEIVRRGVRDLLEAEPDIRVVGEAGTVSSALARIPALHPDVAVLDVQLPDGDGVTGDRMPGDPVADARGGMPDDGQAARSAGET